MDLTFWIRGGAYALPTMMTTMIAPLLAGWNMTSPLTMTVGSRSLG
jgi:hypothetical protein